MRILRPLPKHPELVVFDTPNLCREYHIESWHLAREGSDRVVSRASGFAPRDACAVLLLAVLWPLVKAHSLGQVGLALGTMLYLYARCTQVLRESIIAIPSLGIQFETHRGFPPFTFSVKRTFVSMAELEDIVLNEALYGWNVRYYMAALHRSDDGEPRLQVAFETILPRFPILHPILHDLRSYLNVV
ncbi:hypothetical protein PENSPDRAFT_675151 [Peniophora sp. CONT]|nr:hypothetical protein PENSPDRAFT_675151 [Peniophora sp. CONT]